MGTNFTSVARGSVNALLLDGSVGCEQVARPHLVRDSVRHAREVAAHQVGRGRWVVGDARLQDLLMIASPILGAAVSRVMNRVAELSER